MTDLEGQWIPQILEKETRSLLFQTYERANWLIFLDAYPQLLIYEFSKKMGRPLFHLLPFFSVSRFVEAEWEQYWEVRDGERLLTAQIVNEQNLIQEPVVKDPFYKKKVFQSLFFNFQDWLHFSSVIFPTMQGRLFGFSVHDFTNVDARIELGKKLASLLFHINHFPSFFTFSRKNEHTGSRFDYEKYIKPQGKYRTTPFLRTTFPIVNHHRSHEYDWFNGDIKKKWFEPIQIQAVDITKWYQNKQKQLHLGIILEQLLK